VLVVGKSGNDDATELTVKGAVPIFVSTVFWAGLAVPTNSVGNVSDAGVTAATGRVFDSRIAATPWGWLKSPMPVPDVPSRNTSLKLMSK
jgi:hypothetical protein